MHAAVIWVAIYSVLICLCILAARADATTITGTTQPYQSWVDAARVPTPEGELEVAVDDSCPDALGCTTGGEQITVVAFAPVQTFLHEVGHVFDAAYLTDELRGRFIAITGRPALRWWTGAAPAGEWFADAYAHCALARRIAPRWGYSVGDELLAGWRLQKACWLIRYAAG
jgi:hypothetical protein